MKRLWLIALCGLVGSVSADYKKIRSTSRFYREIKPTNKDLYALSIVLFYDNDEGALDRERNYTKEERKEARLFRSTLRKRIKKQLNDFRGASGGFKEVNFLAVDVSSKDNDELAQAYGLGVYPEIRLFKKGQLYKVNNEAPMLQGSFAQDKTITQPEIIQFLRAYFGKDIQEIIDTKAKVEYELAKARAAAPKYYGGWGYGGWGWGGYPYWGGYYGGWGWRGGCC